MKNQIKGDPGSSKNKNKKQSDGILSLKPIINPELYNWNYKVLNYCDGT